MLRRESLVEKGRGLENVEKMFNRARAAGHRHLQLNRHHPTRAPIVILERKVKRKGTRRKKVRNAYTPRMRMSKLKLQVRQRRILRGARNQRMVIRLKIEKIPYPINVRRVKALKITMFTKRRWNLQAKQNV